MARTTIPFRKLDEVVEILSSVMQRTKCESGCISCNVYRDLDSEDAIMIEETWNNEKDLGRHLQSDEYRKILFVAEMASAPPEIRFSAILRTTGRRDSRNGGNRQGRGKNILTEEQGGTVKRIPAELSVCAGQTLSTKGPCSVIMAKWEWNNFQR
jgi:quinol monooxygenase YgiN